MTLDPEAAPRIPERSNRLRFAPQLRRQIKRRTNDKTHGRLRTRAVNARERVNVPWFDAGMVNGGGQAAGGETHADRGAAAAAAAAEEPLRVDGEAEPQG